MDPSLLYQDNMRAILLETNGRASSSKRTKHIKVKYFRIQDKVDWEEITIKHCPTEQMWTDINTKPKQGAVFRAFRGHVMGMILVNYNDASFATKCNFRLPNWIPEQVSMLPIPRDRVASQECVGEQETNKEVEIWDQSPTKDRRVRFAVGEEVQEPTAEPTKQDRRVPIKTCLEPGDLPGSEAIGEKPRCSMGEGVYSPSHF